MHDSVGLWIVKGGQDDVRAEVTIDVGDVGEVVTAVDASVAAITALVRGPTVP